MTAAALKALKRADKSLAKIINAAGPCTLKIKKSSSPFHSLAESVVYQQLNGTAAKTIWNRVLALYDGKLPTPDQILLTKVADLRSAGLSRAKAAAIADLAQKAKEGVIPTSRAAHKLSDIELVERLTSVRGIGPWTVEMFLIFTLGRPDVMPAADYGVRNGFAITYGLKELPKPKALLEFSEKWKPYRTYAAWYLWRAVDLERAKRTAKQTAKRTAKRNKAK